MVQQRIHSKLLDMTGIQMRPRSVLTQSHAIMLGEITLLHTLIAQCDDYSDRCSLLLELIDIMFLLVELEREFARRSALHIKQ